LAMPVASRLFSRSPSLAATRWGRRRLRRLYARPLPLPPRRRQVDDGDLGDLEVLAAMMDQVESTARARGAGRIANPSAGVMPTPPPAAPVAAPAPPRGLAPGAVSAAADAARRSARPPPPADESAAAAERRAAAADAGRAAAEAEARHLRGRCEALEARAARETERARQAEARAAAVSGIGPRWAAPAGAAGAAPTAATAAADNPLLQARTVQRAADADAAEAEAARLRSRLAFLEAELGAARRAADRAAAAAAEAARAAPAAATVAAPPAVPPPLPPVAAVAGPGPSSTALAAAAGPRRRFRLPFGASAGLPSDDDERAAVAAALGAAPRAARWLAAGGGRAWRPTDAVGAGFPSALVPRGRTGAARSLARPPAAHAALAAAARVARAALSPAGADDDDGPPRPAAGGGAAQAAARLHLALAVSLGGLARGGWLPPRVFPPSASASAVVGPWVDLGPAAGAALAAAAAVDAAGGWGDARAARPAVRLAASCAEILSSLVDSSPEASRYVAEAARGGWQDGGGWGRDRRGGRRAPPAAVAPFAPAAQNTGVEAGLSLPPPTEPQGNEKGESDGDEIQIVSGAKAEMGGGGSGGGEGGGGEVQARPPQGPTRAPSPARACPVSLAGPPPTWWRYSAAFPRPGGARRRKDAAADSDAGFESAAASAEPGVAALAAIATSAPLLLGPVADDPGPSPSPREWARLGRAGAALLAATAEAVVGASEADADNGGFESDSTATALWRTLGPIVGPARLCAAHARDNVEGDEEAAAGTTAVAGRRPTTPPFAIGSASASASAVASTAPPRRALPGPLGCRCAPGALAAALLWGGTLRLGGAPDAGDDDDDDGNGSDAPRLARPVVLDPDADADAGPAAGAGARLLLLCALDEGKEASGVTGVRAALNMSAAEAEAGRGGRDDGWADAAAAALAVRVGAAAAAASVGGAGAPARLAFRLAGAAGVGARGGNNAGDGGSSATPVSALLPTARLRALLATSAGVASALRRAATEGVGVREGGREGDALLPLQGGATYHVGGSAPFLDALADGGSVGGWGRSGRAGERGCGGWAAAAEGWLRSPAVGGAGDAEAADGTTPWAALAPPDWHGPRQPRRGGRTRSPVISGGVWPSAALGGRGGGLAEGWGRGGRRGTQR